MATQNLDRAVAPLATLLETRRGTLLPLPPRLARLYGSLRMPRSRPCVFSNFVSTLDGVVSLGITGHASGGDISGFSAQDRMVMGLLRAVADVVIVGSGTLASDRRHVWTAQAVCPTLADDYRQLRAALGKPAAPLNVIVSGSGDVDLRLPVFSSGEVPVMIVTTTKGARQLQAQQTAGPAARPKARLQAQEVAQHSPPERARQRVQQDAAVASVPVKIHAVATRSRSIAPRAILDVLRTTGAGPSILVEGGPRLLGDFYAAGLLDEQFLTLAPQIVGRKSGDLRLSLVMGKIFAPDQGKWGVLTDIRRGGSHLFLRYAFATPVRQAPLRTLLKQTDRHA